MTKQWTIAELRALHMEWIKTLNDTMDSGPYSDHSNGDHYGSEFISWLGLRQPAEPSARLETKFGVGCLGNTYEEVSVKAAEPREVIHTVGIGYCDNCDCEHCSEIRNPARSGDSQKC